VLAEAGAGRPREARLHWASRTGEKPTEVHLSLDGTPLPLDGQARTALPASAPGTAHVLSAELRFANGVTARKDVALTGDWSGEAATELTSVPVEAAAERALAKEDLLGLFTAGGRALPVAAVDREAPQVFIVRAPGVEADYRAMLPSLYRSVVSWDRPQDDRGVVFHLVAAAPRLERAKDLTTEIFDLTRERALAGKRLGDLLLAGRFRPEVLAAPRLADATAIAGLNAHSRNTPRAALLILRGGEAGDASHLDPAEVRAYLAALGVPLRVWSLTGRGSAAWGEVEDVSTALRLRTAYERFARELARQRIVWLEGRWLPQEIALSPVAVGRGIARVSTAELSARGSPPASSPHDPSHIPNSRAMPRSPKPAAASSSRGRRSWLIQRASSAIASTRRGSAASIGAERASERSRSAGTRPRRTRRSARPSWRIPSSRSASPAWCAERRSRTAASTVSPARRTIDPGAASAGTASTRMTSSASPRSVSRESSVPPSRSTTSSGVS